MPKKRHHSFETVSPGYVHPALTSNKSSPSNETRSLSVNERLQQLRSTSDSKDSARNSSDLAQRLSQRSVPPNVSEILGLPETAAPRPRGNQRLYSRMRTPGPAPPRSWLSNEQNHVQQDSRYRLAPRPPRVFKKRDPASPRPKEPCRFARILGDPMLSNRSLSHMCLRLLAESWIDVDDQILEYIVDFPLSIRLAILSYLGFYGDPETVTIAHLRLLLHGAGSDACVDLSGLVGHGFTLAQIGAALDRARTNSAQSFNGRAAQTQDVADDWEVEDSESDTPSIPALQYSISSNITKLSLACPPPTISWMELIPLTAQLPTLTHLSLAYWPAPSRAPGARNGSSHKAFAAFSETRSPVRSTDLDELREAAALLRQLSRNTYCLRWLDLEGCSAWARALSHGASNHTADRSESWGVQPTVRGPEWDKAWKQMTFLNLSQGHIPHDLNLMEHLFPNADTETGPEAAVWRTFDNWRRRTSHPDFKTRQCESCGKDLTFIGVTDRTLNDCLSCVNLRVDRWDVLNDFLITEERLRSTGAECQNRRGPSPQGPLRVLYSFDSDMSL